MASEGFRKEGKCRRALRNVGDLRRWKGGGPGIPGEGVLGYREMRAGGLGALGGAGAKSESGGPTAT